VDGKAAAAVDSKIAAQHKADNSYIAAMTPHRFGMEVEKFDHHHHWSSCIEDAKALSNVWIRRLATEFSDLSKSLPISGDSSVFMRVHSSKMGFAQMLIIAPEGTPYAHGCFLFDVYFPQSYPNTPPKVNLQTTGGGSHRFNPNLYDSGYVCLSLLGTWAGQKGETWSPKTSTFLQLAVSIQSLIFVPEPYFNEPGYESSIGTPNGQSQSAAYSANQQQATVHFAMIDMLKTPPTPFAEVVRTHFYLKKAKIIAQAEQWAATNERVKSQMPALMAELNKLSAPK